MTTETANNLNATLAELRPKALEEHSGRAGHMIAGGPDSHLTQTVIAMRSGASLSEHENPGEATLLVLEGNVRLTVADASQEGRAGDLLVVPDARHGLEAVIDSAVLLTAVKRVETSLYPS